MPLSDIGSYVVVGQEFEAHWTDVDADRVANTLPVLSLPDGFSLAVFSADLAAVQASITGIEDLDNALGLAANGRNTSRKSVRDAIINFGETVDFKLKGSGYPGNSPKTPQEGASEQKLLKAADDVESLWTRIDADSSVPNFTPPLVLRGGITLASFAADLVTLRDRFKAVTNAESDLKLARTQRDMLLAPFRDRMIEYRQAMQVEYGVGHAFTTTLPDVTASPGSTPDAVTLSGAWEPVGLEALLTWSASSNSNLQHYEVRVSPGATYDSGNSSVAGQVLAGTEEFRTTQELANPGDVASFKVFVVLSTGNQAGSETVVITRP
jgi:hypothetical protein